MNRAGRLWLGLAVAAAAVGASPAGAAGPWDKLLVANRVEADPNKEYRVTENNGPWMISACSFSGEGAPQQARDLVHELRKRYKLPAYVYEKRFDLGKETVGRGVDQFGNPKVMKYARGAELEEIAVLVGDYRTVDDPEAQETLRKIKYYEPECLKLDPDRRTTRTLAALRWIQREILAGDNDKKKRGPMGHAFITTNPLLPKEYFSPAGLDPVVIKANEGVEHCLLDCPGKYTVQVAHFTGRVLITTKPHEIAEAQSGRQESDTQLAEAAEMAHKLTQALRLKGYEAYEFHDRYASIVTVGSFAWVKRTMPGGGEDINPAVREVIERFRGRPSDRPGHEGQLGCQSLLGIPFAIQPIPVHVPRRSIAAAYSRDAVGSR